MHWIAAPYIPTLLIVLYYNTHQTVGINTLESGRQRLISFLADMTKTIYSIRLLSQYDDSSGQERQCQPPPPPSPRTEPGAAVCAPACWQKWEHQQGLEVLLPASTGTKEQMVEERGGMISREIQETTLVSRKVFSYYWGKLQTKKGIKYWCAAFIPSYIGIKRFIRVPQTSSRP